MCACESVCVCAGVCLFSVCLCRCVFILCVFVLCVFVQVCVYSLCVCAGVCLFSVCLFCVCLCRCVCQNDADRWHVHQLLDHVFLRPPSPKSVAPCPESSSEGEARTQTHCLT